MLCSFETVCRCYFANKGITAAEQVEKVIYNFEAASVQSWVMADEDHLLTLTFKEFLTEFKLKFLARSWEDELVQDQITLQGNTVFLTWINKVRNANDELHTAGLAYCIIPDHFQLHLIP